MGSWLQYCTLLKLRTNVTLLHDIFATGLFHFATLKKPQYSSELNKKLSDSHYMTVAYTPVVAFLLLLTLLNRQFHKFLMYIATILAEELICNCPKLNIALQKELLDIQARHFLITITS